MENVSKLKILLLHNFSAFSLLLELVIFLIVAVLDDVLRKLINIHICELYAFCHVVHWVPHEINDYSLGMCDVTFSR